MKKLILIIFLLIPAVLFGQRTFVEGLIIGPSGDTVGSAVILNDTTLRFTINDTIYDLSSGDFLFVSDTAAMLLTYINKADTAAMLTSYINRSDTLYDVSFQDAHGSYIKILNGSVEENTIDYEKTLLPVGNAYGGETFELATDSSWAYCSGGITEADWIAEVTNGQEAFDILSASNDTIYIDGTWTVADGNHILVPGYFLMRDLASDTTYYGSNKIHNLSKTRTYNQVQAPIQVNDNYGIVSKVGGMLWRTDNWLVPSHHANEHMTALSNYFAVFDKYHMKGLWALNEYDERYYGTENGKKYLKFFADVQARGHEIADHGPVHSNYWYLVHEDYYDGAETVDIPGIAEVNKPATVYTVRVDTLDRAVTGFSQGSLTRDAFDIMMWKGQKMFKFFGLNPFTYWIEGGGQGVIYHPDSVFAGSFKNLSLGGGKYSELSYKHMGFNPPLDWIGKSEYFMDWSSTESINLSDYPGDPSARAHSATNIIKKLTDQSAKHTLTIFKGHIQSITPAQWYLSCMDSIFYFAFSHQAHIRNFTGTQAAKVMYQSQTNPYINYMPANPLTGQCFEDNIDAAYGDTMPDGWDIGTEAAYWEDGGSQCSKGYVSIGTTKADNLQLTRMYGIEKGLNQFTIDVKDKGANDTVYVEISYYYGATFPTLSHTEVQFAFPSTTEWTTNDTTITFPYNTTYFNMNVWSRTADSYVDELTLKKSGGDFLFVLDTADMLVPYINRSDTAAMLSNYAELTEIVDWEITGAEDIHSDRIQDNLIDHDNLLNFLASEHVVYVGGNGITRDGTDIDLGGALDAPTTITGTEVNNLSIKMSDAGDRSTKLVFQGDLSMRSYTGDDHTGDSSFVTVDSNLVSMGIYDGVLIKSITIGELGMIVTDNYEGKGLSLNEDYSAAATSLYLMPRIYIDENLGGQDLDANVYSPAAANHGDVLIYDSNGHYNGTDTYKLQATNPITSTARVGLRAIDTVLFSGTTADTIVILPVAVVIDKILVYIGTAFDGSGTNFLDVGISTDGDKYENDLDLEDTSFEFYELANLPNRTASTTYVTRKYTDQNSNASAGFAIVYVYYTIF